MIYLIDDKKSRQNSYGWTDDRFDNFKESLVRIVGEEDLKEHLNHIPISKNVILIHDSFLDDLSDTFNKLKSKIEEIPELLVCHFSGSYNSRVVKEKIAYLSPHMLYTNLEIFINEHIVNNTDLRYLAFGKNIDKEEYLKKNYSEFVNNNKNISYGNNKSSKKSRNKIAYFQSTGDLAIVSPFNEKTIENWDFPTNKISFQDVDFDTIIKNELSTDKFDILYLPLCFGETFSDYMGLRFAMYIRFSQSCNQNTPIVLYGYVQRVSEIIDEACFDALKLPNIKLVGLNYDMIIHAADKVHREIEMSKFDIKRINIQLPQRYNDNHDVSNIWSLHRWHSMFNWGPTIPKIANSNLTKSLYFRYLEILFGIHDKFKKNKKREPKIPNFEKNKRIVYIDDDHSKGWDIIFKTLFNNSGVEFDFFDQFDKKFSKNELRELLLNFIQEHDADCYILGIKLHSDDFLDNSTKPLGLEIAKRIKELNRGNQIVFFTASNDIRNYDDALNNINAAGYILKEAPFENFSTKDTSNSYIEFTKVIREVCNNRSFLRRFYSQQNELSDLNKKISNTLEPIGNLLTIYSEVSTNNITTKQDILGAILLYELNFLHRFITELGFYLHSEGPTGNLTKLKLCNRTDSTYSKDILRHLFCKKEKGQNGHNIISDISQYYESVCNPDNDWEELSNTELTLDVSFLRIVMGFSDKTIKKYLNWRNIRNTQIAHFSSNTNTLKLDDILNFYNWIIVPAIKKFS